MEIFPRRLQFYCLIVILISVAVTTNGVAVVRLEAAPKPGVRVVSAQTADLPEPWVDVDVGASGNSSFVNGTFTLEGSGAGIKGKSDRFHFVCAPLKGDGQVVAHVTSIQSTSPWAVAGVMVREDLTPGARNVSFLVTPGNGLAFQSRRQVAGRTSSVVESSMPAPCWLMLERVGKTINGYYSQDGVDWTLFESAKVRMSNAVCVGLAVASHDTQLAATSKFDGVSVGPIKANGMTLTLNPTTVPGGSPSQGTVSLLVPAPTTGAQVSLQSSDVSAGKVPSTVLVPPKALSATFTVTTNPVSISTPVNISSEYGGATSTAKLTVMAPQAPPPGVDLASLVVNPTTVVGGNPSQGTVTLTGAAPSGGTLVTLLSSNTTAATVPPAVTVPSGALSASFTVSSTPVSSTAVVTISASSGNSTKTATLTVTPPPPPAPNLLSVTLNPTSVVGGNGSQGTVTLTRAAPATGLAVTLSSNTAVATVPASVTVPPGATSAAFTVATSKVSSTTSVTITGRNGATTRTATLTVTAPAPPTPAPVDLSSVSLNPTTVVGGNSSQGTVNLTGAAPSGGLVVSLSRNNAAATVPLNATVPAGSTSATFTVATISVSSTVSVTVTARNGATTRTATLTVSPPAPSITVINVGDIWRYFKGLTNPGVAWNQLTFNDASWLSGPSGIGYGDGDDATVLTDMQGSSGYLTVYARKTFQVADASQVVGMALIIDYDDGFVAYLNGVEVARRSMPAGTPSHTTAAMDHEAGTPESIDLTAAQNALVVGTNVLAVEVHNALLDSSDLSFIPALNLQTAGALPPPPPPAPVDLSSVSLNPTTVVGGNSSQGTVTLTGAAPSGGLVVSLSSNNAAATVPANVTIAAGASTAAFAVSTNSVASTTNVTLSAAYNGSARTATLTLNPPAAPPPPGSGTTYWVSPSGSDSNPGTQAAPFKTIQKAADTVNPGDTVIVEDGTYTDTDGNGIIVSVNRGGTSTNWVVFRSRNKWGAKLDGQNNTAKSGWKFGSGGSYVRVENFEVFGIGNAASGGHGFESYVSAHDLQIIGNHIHDIGRLCTSTSNGESGIFFRQNRSVPQSGNLLIEGNLIHDIGRFAPGEQGCNPTNDYYKNHDHAIYLSDGDDVTISNNIIYNAKRGWAVHIYPRNYARLKILNNTFAFPNPYRDSHIILNAASISDGRIQNNVFYSPTNEAITFRGSSYSNVLVGNNIIFGGVIGNTTPSGVTLTNNRNNTDPLLVNPAGFDFHLRTGSPAIDAGVTLSSVTLDFEGRSRPQGIGYDVGAFEFGSAGSMATSSSQAVSPSTTTLTASNSAGSVSGQVPVNVAGSSPSLVAAGLVCYWSFDEGTGSATNDSSGNGNNGTLANEPTWVGASNCRSGKCLSFNGLDNYVRIPNAPSLQVTGDLTISFIESFKGLMDEVRIYNRALSDSEVLALFNQ